MILYIGLASVKGIIYLCSYISINKGSYKLILNFIKYFFPIHPIPIPNYLLSQKVSIIERPFR